MSRYSKTTDNNEDVGLEVYPNPTTGVFTLTIDVKNEVTVQIITVQGELTL